MTIQDICLYADYKADESYTPSRYAEYSSGFNSKINSSTSYSKPDIGLLVNYFFYNTVEPLLRPPSREAIRSLKASNISEFASPLYLSKKATLYTL